MTTKQQMQEQANKAERELAALKAQIEAMPDDKVSGVWKPERGERYYYITAEGRCCVSQWFDDDVHRPRYAFGNVFHAEQDAYNYVRFRKIEQRLRKLAGGWEP